MAFREGAMVSVDLLYRKAGPRLRRVLDGIILIAGLILMATIVWFGFDYAWRARFQTISGLESFSMTWAYLAMPVGGVFSIIALFAHWFDPRRHELEVAQ
jgi:TRAP-type C4-dicarboxylate transport system permease small subunit